VFNLLAAGVLLLGLRRFLRTSGMPPHRPSEK
jgi:hypothetical protein